MNIGNPLKKKKTNNPMVDGSSKKSFINLSAIKAYAVFIISITVIVAVTVWVIIPGYSQYKELNEEIKKQEKELTKYTAQANFMQSLYDKKDELLANIETAKLSMADEEDAIPYILDQTIQISEQSGVTLSGLSLGGVSPVNDVEGLYEVRINTKIDGSYDEVMDYLDRLQNAQRLIDVKNISISLNHNVEASDNLNNNTTDEITSDAEELGPTYGLNLSLSSYYMEEIDVSKLSIDRLTQESNIDSIIEKIKELEYYPPNEDAISVEIGKDNPFQIGEFKDGEFVEDEENNDTTDDRNIPDL